MQHLREQVLNHLIKTEAFLTHYPVTNVTFVSIASIFADPPTRNTLSKMVLSSIDRHSFDSVGSVSTRGYLFSGMIVNELKDKGENLVEKVKRKGDPRFIQLDAKTEYSKEALQILKGTIVPGKKYILTDDLIATGGSLIAATELIRSCGGIVDQACVMSELLDFDARNKLKALGVELTSLFKFTENDLNKLVIIQNSYAANPEMPLTYHLSHYSKGDKTVIYANENKPLELQIASQSPLKVEACQHVFHALFDPLEINLIAKEVASGVSSQPFGDEETKVGVLNRLKELQKEVKDPRIILVAMESGIRFSEEDQNYYDFVHVIVQQGERIYHHSQDCCVITPNVMQQIKKNETGQFLETWGEAAHRMGLAKNPKDPHQEEDFGKISRTEHLERALCIAVGKLKASMLENSPAELEEQTFDISRLIELQGQKSEDVFAEEGILFTSTEEIISKPINFYNQGCPVKKWDIAPEKVARNEFKIFSTGDAFSRISSNIEINGAHINIHVGIEHATYSPLVLIQEALQLCRSAREHGVRSITVALPDRFHPVAQFNDFNNLLLKLFATSGANKIYYYDKTYNGKLDETNLNNPLPLTLSDKTNNEQYKIARKELDGFLRPPQNPQIVDGKLSLDQQISYVIRKKSFEHQLSKFAQNSGLIECLGEQWISELKVPEIKVQPHVILCGSINKALAYKIADSLRLRGEMVQFYFIEGRGDQAKIPEEAMICGATVTIIQSTRPSPEDVAEVADYQKNGSTPYLFEAAMIARQAHLRGAKTINLINPYQFNARSDKAEDNNKGKTGAYVQQNGLLLKAAGINQVITAECHDNHTMSGSYTSEQIRGSAIPALSIISARLAHEWLEDHENPMKGLLRLVTPDAGAAKRTKELTELLPKILKKHFCQTRILGEKLRNSDKDDSALISSLNSGSVGISPDDKYLITDDETATGTTLCQAIESLKKDGAKDIAVEVAHNNMPVDWLERQLCLGNFFYFGATELHFSDTHEMGTLATSYDDLILLCSKRYNLSVSEAEARALDVFKNIFRTRITNKSEAEIAELWEQYKSVFHIPDSKIRIHSLADEFANTVLTKPYMVNPYAFEHNVDKLVTAIRNLKASHIVAFAGTSLAVVAAANLKLGLPLQIIPQAISGQHYPKISLPNSPFVMIGTPNELTRSQLEINNGLKWDVENQVINGELRMVNKPSEEAKEAEEAAAGAQSVQNAFIPSIQSSLGAIEDLYLKIKSNPRWKDSPLKLLGIGDEGQILAGQLYHLLNEKGYQLSMAAIDFNPHINSVLYTGNSSEETLYADRNSLGMGDVTIAIGKDLTESIKEAMRNLATDAKINCPYFASITAQGQCQIAEEGTKISEMQGIYSARSRLPLFSPVKVQIAPSLPQSLSFNS